MEYLTKRGILYSINRQRYRQEIIKRTDLLTNTTNLNIQKIILSVYLSELIYLDNGKSILQSRSCYPDRCRQKHDSSFRVSIPKLFGQGIEH